jgi:uncharacterized RmlC-like cupin family protein
MNKVRVRRIGPEDRATGDPTPGMVREEAVSTDGFWSGVVRMAPGTSSGWHHHGGNTTIAFVLSGVRRLEFGPGGRDVVEGGPGDFLYVAPGVVHRESNPTDEDARAVAFRTRTGPPTINVEGPEGER